MSATKNIRQVLAVGIAHNGSEVFSASIHADWTTKDAKNCREISERMNKAFDVQFNEILIIDTDADHVPLVIRQYIRSGGGEEKDDDAADWYTFRQELEDYEREKYGE